MANKSERCASATSAWPAPALPEWWWSTSAPTSVADDELFARLEPLLHYMGSDVTHCGEVGCRHVVKLINNTLVFEHTAALAEMLVVGERGGVAPETLLQAVAKGSGDSFVLRNHGMKAMVPRNFPDRAFPSERYYTGAVERGLGHKYFPVIAEIIEEQGR